MIVKLEVRIVYLVVHLVFVITGFMLSFNTLYINGPYIIKEAGLSVLHMILVNKLVEL